MKNNINAAPYLDNQCKQNLLLKLEQMESGNQLCHGDFHVLNLMETPEGVKIIDWVDASSGNIIADVCRSYLLYLLYKKEVAEIYLDLYCDEANINKQDVLKWLPIIAGARLNENVTEQDINMLKILIDNES